MKKKIFLRVLMVFLLNFTFASAKNPPLHYQQGFADFSFESNTLVTGFGQEDEWSFSSSGSAPGSLSYTGNWGSGVSAGFRGDQMVLGYQHTTSTGTLTATLTICNNTGGHIHMLNISYTGRAQRITMGRSPQWNVFVNDNEIPELFYSTEAGVDEHKHAQVSVNIPPGDNIIIKWESDNGHGSGSSKQIGIAEVEVFTGNSTQASAPEFHPTPGVYLQPVNVNMSSQTSDAQIFYTINGDDPTQEDILFDHTPVFIEENTTIKAFAFHPSLDPSPVSTGIYVIDHNVSTISGVDNPAEIITHTGIALENLDLPHVVLTYFQEVPPAFLDVQWTWGDYNQAEAGSYIIYGTLQHGDSIINPQNIQPWITITLFNENTYFPVVFNLVVSHQLGFDPEHDQIFITGSMFDWAIPGLFPGQMMQHHGDLNFSNPIPLTPGTYNYRYYLNSGLSHPEGGPDRWVVVDGPLQIHDSWVLTNINKFEKQTTRVFPNPAGSHIHIKTGIPFRQLMIFAGNGQRVHYSQTVNNEITIDISHLASGIYSGILIMEDYKKEFVRFQIQR